MKSIMIQGTASNVGKSLICTALCRIFRQDGRSVTPFKSQNMALNSFITREGLEIGRAQAVQAEAAGIEPLADMNPVLLKPQGGQSQIIIQGEVAGYADARQYYSYKDYVAGKIRESWERLSARYDTAVIEGAGSPAEINLKDSDVSNMFTARLTGSPVLLAGDISPGGVFAQIVGTNVIFDEEERRYFKGILINKFRGDAALLKPGLDMLENMVHRPVLGVIPYSDFDIEDEDSMSERFKTVSNDAAADAAVIRLPCIANFTDFNALSRTPGLRVRYAGSAAALGRPDLVILPGTKSTMADLAWLRRTGLATAITDLAAAGCPVFGVCGGYQMLGETLSDPNGAETGGELRGLGLLPVRTVFESAKVRTRVRGRFECVGGIFSSLSHLAMEGYEVHMGVTAPAGAAASSLCSVQDQVSGQTKADGACLGNIYGTYVHGIFDAPGVSEAVLNALRAAKDAAPDQNGAADFLPFQAYKEAQYDRLADVIRHCVDIDRIYAIMDAGV